MEKETPNPVKRQGWRSLKTPNQCGGKENDAKPCFQETNRGVRTGKRRDSQQRMHRFGCQCVNIWDEATALGHFFS